MKDERKTKRQLIGELAETRARVRRLEEAEAQRNRAEEALGNSEERHRKIVETIKEGYYELDLRGSFTYVNDRSCELLGYSRDRPIGMNYTNFVDRGNVKKSFEAFNKVYKTGEPMEVFDYEVIRSDGTRRYLELSIYLMPGSKEGTSVFCGIGRDVTDRKRTEERLRRAHDELEKRVRERTEELVEANAALKREITVRGNFTETLQI